MSWTWPSCSPPGGRAFYNPRNRPHGLEVRLADAEPPEDEGHSPDGEPAPAETHATAATEMAAVTPVTDVPPGNPLEQRARLAEDRLTEVMAAYRTLKIENEDFRERQSRNIERRFEQRREKLLLKFIDVLDNLDRALEAAQTSYAGQPLLEGMILVRTQLLQTLQDEGLDRIPVVGLPFDPAVSESVSTAPVKEPEQDHVVVKELLRGYRLNGRVARASRVVIGIFEGGATPDAEGTAPAASAAAASPAAAEAPAAAVAASGAAEPSDPAAVQAASIPEPSTPRPIPPKAPGPRRKGR
jgi:molecular chaperone GrpE